MTNLSHDNFHLSRDFNAKIKTILHMKKEKICSKMSAKNGIFVDFYFFGF